MNTQRTIHAKNIECAKHLLTLAYGVSNWQEIDDDLYYSGWTIKLKNGKTLELWEDCYGTLQSHTI